MKGLEYLESSGIRIIVCKLCEGKKGGRYKSLEDGFHGGFSHFQGYFCQPLHYLSKGFKACWKSFLKLVADKSKVLRSCRCEF